MLFQEQDFSFAQIKQFFIPLTTKKAIHWIIIIGIVVYGNMLLNGFVGDDDGQVVKNIAIHAITNIPNFFLGGTFYSGDVSKLTGIYYRPIASSFYTILYVLFGSNPFPFHLFQLGIHITNAIFVFLIFRFFLKKNIAFFLTLLFLVHPIQAETVDYVADLQDTLFFFFGTCAFYLELRSKTSNKKLFISTILLLLSVYSKETGVLFVIAILLYKFLFRSHKENKRTLFVYSSAVFFYVLFRILFVHGLTSHISFSPIVQTTVGVRFLTVPLEIFYYLRTVIFPVHLAVNQMWLATNKTTYEYIVVAIFDTLFVALLIIVGTSICNKHKHYFKPFIFFTTWFVIGLLLHLNIIVRLDNTVSDRWFYFPFVGLLGIIGILIQMYIIKKEKFNKIFFILMGLLLIILSIRTMVRNTNFHDSYSLLAHDTKYAQGNSYMYSALALELIKQKRFNEAYTNLQKSIKLNPKGEINWNILGNYYQSTGQIQKAEEAYKISIKNAPYYLSYEDLGILLLLHEKPEVAEVYIKSALQKFPTDGYLWFLFTLVENKMGKKDIALESAKRTIMYISNNDTYLLYNLLSQNLPVTFKAVQNPEGTIIYVCSPSACN